MTETLARALRSVEMHISVVDEVVAAAFGARTESAAVAEARGRVLAESVSAPVDLPLFRNSQMDGYAVDAASVSVVPVTLPITGTTAAGDPSGPPLAAGTARRIMTGAPMPAGANAVIPVEDTRAEDLGIDGTDAVTILVGRRSGDFVRDVGSDIAAGSELLLAGTVLAPRHLGALAAVGVATVTVRARPRVAVIATGAELVEAGTPLEPGRIHDSNGVTLATSLAEDGAEVVLCGRSTDDPDEFLTLLRRATDLADVVITSGGVSMGDFEVVRDALLPLGGDFGTVALQPGGPQGLCVLDGTPVLNFPGNPVSTLVSYVVFARTPVRAAAGLPPLPVEAVALDAPVHSRPHRRQFLRGVRTDTGVTPFAGVGSHLVATMAKADVLIDIDADVTEMAAGEHVRVWTL